MRISWATNANGVFLVAGLVSLACAGCAHRPEVKRPAAEETPLVENSPLAPVDARVRSSNADGAWMMDNGRIQELEEKAAGHDALVKKNAELEAEAQRLREAVARSGVREALLVAAREPSRIEKLEQRAKDYPALRAELDGRDQDVIRMEKELADERERMRRAESEAAAVRAELESMIAKNADLMAQMADLQRTLDEVLLGRYEYYEVKAGDTLASIAAQPLIYGDETKKEWLRQANARRVQDLGSLRPGQVLIVPRFPPAGRYDF